MINILRILSRDRQPWFKFGFFTRNTFKEVGAKVLYKKRKLKQVMAKVPSVVFNILSSFAVVPFPSHPSLPPQEHAFCLISLWSKLSPKLINSPRCPQHIQPKRNYQSPTQNPTLLSSDGTYPLTGLANSVSTLKVDQMSAVCEAMSHALGELQSVRALCHLIQTDDLLARWLTHFTNFLKNKFPHSFNSTKVFII